MIGDNSIIWEEQKVGTQVGTVPIENETAKIDEVNYGEGIKTLRLWNGRVGEMDDPKEEDEEEDNNENSLLNKNDQQENEDNPNLENQNIF